MDAVAPPAWTQRWLLINASLLLLSFVSFLLPDQTAAQSSSAPPTSSPPRSLPTAGDYILLNCGDSGRKSDQYKRNWTGDIGSSFAASSSQNIAVPAATFNNSVPRVPYMTARIILTTFTYTFPVSPGRKFVRLHFYPSNYSDDGIFSAGNSRFTVTANPGNFTLLSNFSASRTAKALNVDYLIHEFSVNVSSRILNLTFTRKSDVTGFYAFVNGIEIISIPIDLFRSDSNDIPIVGMSTTYPFGETTALQTMNRLNVGGNAISPISDVDLFRSWGDDSFYIIGAATGVSYGKDDNVSINYSNLPPYPAPEEVYGTARSMGPHSFINLQYNLTWLFSVDPGFLYLVRMHFCEIQYPYTRDNMRVFSIYLNNETAVEDADVIVFSGGIGSAVFKDFVVLSTGGSDLQDFWVALHPSQRTKPMYYDAILNGLEIFKMSSTDGNLAVPNPNPLPNRPTLNQTKGGQSAAPRQKKKSNTVVIAGVAGGIAASVLLVCGLSFMVFSRCRQGENGGRPSGYTTHLVNGNSQSSAFPTTKLTEGYLCRHFSLAEIRAATNDFDETLLLGVGGFGKVYRGEIDGGLTKVAVKRGNPTSEQGVNEFQTEVEMLSNLRHRHLVSLIGYCEESQEMILVYDYMTHGSLREHLYKTQKSPLPWKLRLQICIGAARGLDYLHNGAKHAIIHRDVKSTNILLDEKWVAKLSDFGLSKTGTMLDRTYTHVSTAVKGSFGYLDPEYFRRQMLTKKSDVYSFGVVLFEVLCGRPALNMQLPDDEVNLAEWALRCLNEGTLDRVLDPYLKDTIQPECFRVFTETAKSCLADRGVNRPAMGEVLRSLEQALQLQKSVKEIRALHAGQPAAAARRYSLSAGSLRTTQTCVWNPTLPQAPDPA